MSRPEPADVARRLLASRYPDAAAVFLCGSAAAGRATSTSDLDLVVLYEHRDSARRESFVADEWPVEAFLHDPATLLYFFEEFDRPTGIPNLAHMIVNGLLLPSDHKLGLRALALAHDALDIGPHPWSDGARDAARYAITDMATDLEGAQSASERRAIATSLYGKLSEFVCRSRGRWAAKGKWIPRRLKAVDPSLADRTERAFAELFVNDRPNALVALAAEVLESCGGVLFEGYHIDSSPTCRVEPPALAVPELYSWGEGCSGAHMLDHPSLSVIREVVPPGKAEVRHCHQRSRQFFYIESGTAQLEFSDRILTLSMGEGVHVAPGVLHRFCNQSDVPVVFLVISSPTTRGDRVER